MTNYSSVYNMYNHNFIDLSLYNIYLVNYDWSQELGHLLYFIRNGIDYYCALVEMASTSKDVLSCILYEQ